MQKWVTQYGVGAFNTLLRRGFEDKLPNLNAISVNKENQWF